MSLFKASSFPGDPYGWFTNQCSHILVGVVAAYSLCLIYYIALGEYPYRATVWIIMLVTYLLYEVIDQGYRGLDTVEDTLFTVFYGAGSALYAFKEQAAGGSDLVFKPDLLLPFLYVAVGHLGVGSVYRYRMGGKDAS